MRGAQRLPLTHDPRLIYKGGHEEDFGNMEFDELSNKVTDWQLRLNIIIQFIFQFFVLFVLFVVKIIICSDLFGLGMSRLPSAGSQIHAGGDCFAMPRNDARRPRRPTLDARRLTPYDV